MGNKESNTLKKHNENMPIKSAIKKTPVARPVNEYNYYPNQSMPEQYAYPIHPASYPVVSNENYLHNEFYPRPKTKNKVIIQPVPTYHYYYDQHSSYDNHHHHRSALPSEKERLRLPILTERATSPRRLSPLPSVQAQKPVSSVVTHKLTSVADKNLKTPSPLPVRQLPSVIAKKSATFVLPVKYSSHVAVNQHQFSQPTSIPSSSFEKAPIIETNYVPKSASNRSFHKYGPDTMSVVRRSSSQFTTPGNRWYDHDYDKRLQPFTIIDV